MLQANDQRGSSYPDKHARREPGALAPINFQVAFRTS